MHRIRYIKWFTNTPLTLVRKMESLPTGYIVPKIWSPPAEDGPFGGMNSDVSGERTVKTLPRGKHGIQLYSQGTPNGQKVTIMLEELDIDYDAWLINIMNDDQFSSGFVEINPNSKIPAMVDYTGDKPQRVFESVSILLYLAEKYGKFIPKDHAEKTECMNWLIWQVGTAPYIGGGFGHFYKYAPIKIKYAIDRYTMETRRILSVLDKHLEGREYICGEYSIADIANFPWYKALVDNAYDAKEFLQLDQYKNVARWVETIRARPAVKRGLRVNGFGDDAVLERHARSDFD